MQHPENSQNLSSPPSGDHGNSSAEDLAAAKENLVRCLEQLDAAGEEGLQAELDRIYSGPPPTPTAEAPEWTYEYVRTKDGLEMRVMIPVGNR